ncbi:hypothetical protein CLOBOL_06605 [Enterocloster bolteae ATCC BAA-613]|uniref:Uncharacterized protein n=1 Tax=Enterocloster bolteae (strain ATCC BAA-613 / DSM 15670 / CCUG 46953 / JCM 12243 / WAL 16351) TaxID=411902 RepID=A8S3G2_ENTBW|nr:hypothetical protein CLOBOL_06605 [Enterocloster bolteae ATCC BAA-613]
MIVILKKNSGSQGNVIYALRCSTFMTTYYIFVCIFLSLSESY